MIDKKLKKKFLSETVGLSRTTISHLNHDEHVSTESLMKICNHLKCDIGDIISMVYDEHDWRKYVNNYSLYQWERMNN